MKDNIVKNGRHFVLVPYKKIAKSSEFNYVFYRIDFLHLKYHQQGRSNDRESPC